MTFQALNRDMLNYYMVKLKSGKSNLANLSETEIYELMSVTRNNSMTLSATLLFSLYPQAFFPQLCITAVVIPGVEIGENGAFGERFLDNMRIEGNIAQMLDSALQFVRKNMRTRTIINSVNGKREDRSDYPITAVREAVINALVHRDYSIHTEGMPIQILMFEDRMEIRNPGGICGRIKNYQLGKVQPDTRNPVLATALEVLEITENRYSGIPTIRREMAAYELKEPVFLGERGGFVVKFYKKNQKNKINLEQQSEDIRNLLIFCKTPRTRKEICDFLGLSSVTYVIQTHIMPLVGQGLIKMSIPEKPKSTKQLYYSVDIEIQKG